MACVSGVMASANLPSAISRRPWAWNSLAASGAGAADFSDGLGADWMGLGWAGASFGAAVCAGVGAGIWKSTEEGAASVASFERTVEPEPGPAAAYRDLYEKWQEIYRGSMELAESGLVRPLWRAAGT